MTERIAGWGSIKAASIQSNCLKVVSATTVSTTASIKKHEADTP